MKKIVFAVMAIVAIGFTACGNKTQSAEVPVDSAAIVDSLASAAAQTDIDALNELLAAGDATKLQEALAAVKEEMATLIKENPEVAKEYVAKVQDFLKENADKVKAVVGDNAAVQTAVSAITETEPADIVNGFLNSVGDAATEAKDAAKQKANEAIDNAAKDVKKGLGL